MDLSTRQGRREQGTLIQKAVERAGLSVEELAHRIGCSRALIYQYLSGTTLAQPDRLQQIAAETAVPLAYFYGAGIDEGRRGRRGDVSDSHTRFNDRLQQLDELARAYESPPDWTALASTCERIATLAAQFEDDGAEARALLRLGKAQCHVGEFRRAAESLRRAADLYAAMEDGAGEASARQALGHALLATGDTTEASEQFEAVAKSGTWKARWTGAVSLAGVYEQLGDYRTAMAKCDEAAAVLEEANAPDDAAFGMLYVNANRVNLYLACGDFESAYGLAQRCLQDAEALGVSDQHVEARLNIGVCDYYRGRWAASRATLTSALRLARFMGDQSREAMARATLAIVLGALCDCDACIEHAKDALAAALARGDHRAELFAQVALADAYFTLARDAEARYHANQALAVATALRLPLYEAVCRARIGRLCLHLRDVEEAREPLERAHSVSVQLGARHVEAEALVLLGEYKLRTDDVAGAESHANEAAALARKMGAIPLEWEAAGLLARIACAKEPPDSEAAEAAGARAVVLIEQVRAEVNEAGIPDMILEDRNRLAIYQLRAKNLADLGRASEADQFVENTGWPPLSAGISRPRRGAHRG